MWVFNNNSFISAVETKEKPDILCVRSRIKEDLYNFFESYSINIVDSDDTDYKFRTYIDKETFAELLKQKALKINYTNFKDSILKEETLRKSIYLEIWAILWNWQQRVYNLEDWWLNYRERSKK